MKTVYILCNFGGPRDLSEIEEFLIELLTDQDVVRTELPSFFHKVLFKRIAKKRARKISKEYEKIGGKSPIFEDTECAARILEENLAAKVYTFHRYLPKTHAQFIEDIKKEQADEIVLFPFFPQFSYATTGSIARFFDKRLPPAQVVKMRWIRAYYTHPEYIALWKKCIKEFLQEKALKEEETAFIFSAHGIPVKFMCTGDVYEKECKASFLQIKEAFPQSKSILAYQSKFGPGRWLKPYTNEICEDPSPWVKGYKNVVIVPLSFTSDHIETLFEIEEYASMLKDKGWNAYRCPAFNRRTDWMDTILSILKEENSRVSNQMLIRHPKKCCMKKCSEESCLYQQLSS